MAPVYHKLRSNNFNVKICVTAQHREMLDQVLDFFQISPDFDLNLMKPNQTLNGLSAVILKKMDLIFETESPDLVLVHGDTTTSALVALSAFHRGIKVGHIEAGLRTYNKREPFPEELNRQITSKIADIHFTPTKKATQNLLTEGIQRSAIIETGNTVIDALFWTVNKIKNNFESSEINKLKKITKTNKKIILITGHRRENFGEGFENICQAILEISKRKDVLIIYPVHLNPNVKDLVFNLLSDKQNIFLIEPISYPAFVWLMKKSFFIISDSGGIQEEAPSLGKPVLVTRNVSERLEGIIEGFSVLVGTDVGTIVSKAEIILDGFKGFGLKENPFGDGRASDKISDFLLNINKNTN